MNDLRARLRAPGQRAIREAGPPRDLTVAAVVIGVIAAAAVWIVTDPAGPPPWPWLVLLPGILSGTVAAVDVDGRLVRRAMAWIALEQQRRWGPEPVLRTPAEADRWLADPVNREAARLRRASALIAAGRWEEARAAVAAMTPADGVERASRERMLATIDGRAAGEIDRARIAAATDDLPADERRYQRVAAAWSQVWLDVEAGRTAWRPRFAATIRDLGPFPVPGRVAVVIALQQFAAPIACVLAVGVLAIVWGR